MSTPVLATGISGSNTVSREPPVASAASLGERQVALEFVKGALVLCMVVYHSVNYFHHKQTVLQYLHFLPPSFIFIAGFLVSSVYLIKYEAADWRLSQRLFIRGLKLLLVFVLLNVAVNTLF